MEIQKDPTGEGTGKNRDESPSEVQPPGEETIVPGEDQRQPITDEASLKEAENTGEETFSEDKEEDEYDNYCPVCGHTGGCTCGNSELYSGHPWVFD
jgi:hypothetical protein